WVGTWTNKRYDTTGPLKCVAQPVKDGSWKATFSGRFQGRPFSYDVTFKAQPGKGGEALSGSATVNGFRYQWTGVLKGDTLTGRRCAAGTPSACPEVPGAPRRASDRRPGCAPRAGRPRGRTARTAAAGGSPSPAACRNGRPRPSGRSSTSPTPPGRTRTGTAA